MADERREAKRLAVSMAVGMFAAQVVGGPNDRFLAHLPFYANPLIMGLVAGVASLIGCPSQAGHGADHRPDQTLDQAPAFIQRWSRTLGSPLISFTVMPGKRKTMLLIMLAASGLALYGLLTGGMPHGTTRWFGTAGRSHGGRIERECVAESLPDALGRAGCRAPPQFPPAIHPAGVFRVLTCPTTGLKSVRQEWCLTPGMKSGRPARYAGRSRGVSRFGIPRDETS
jgi:hypothetical protein